MKRELRYIRYRICRNIYYADQCPNDCRKNYKAIGYKILCAIGMCVVALGLMVVLVLMA